ncbi:MAG: hypothetical protein IJB75_02775 [Oscillospiraceae bacterium]|nr:hypothetical protein [Oscillospiraceae bacterium]MBQ7088404.1 hypothetical protein [Clostridia bacterium]
MAQTKRKYKPLPLSLMALRNFSLFVVVFGLILSFLLIGGNDLTAFYNEKHFEKYATVTSRFEEREGKWADWTEHVITLEKVSKRYQYVGAVVDFSRYEPEDCFRNGGVIRLDYRAVSNRQQLEHILILNPCHPIEKEGSDLIVYTDNAALNEAYNYHSAEEFYALQEEYEQTHANIFAILQNDFDHIMYNLVQGSGLRWIVPIVLMIACALYAFFVHKKREDMTDEGLSTITILWGVSLLATSIGIMGLALVGGDMAAEGGIGSVVVIVTSIATAVCGLLYVFSMLLPLLLDIDFAYGFSTFWIKVIVSCVVAMLVFGLGVMLEALMETYAIFHTVLMILLVVAALMSFFAFAGFLAARSVIFKTYMDISLATCEMAERVGSVWLMLALSTQVANLDAEIGLGRNYWLEKKKKVLEETIDSLAEDL